LEAQTGITSSFRQFSLKLYIPDLSIACLETVAETIIFESKSLISGQTTENENRYPEGNKGSPRQACSPYARAM
jgi:hypothetical protein